MKRSSWITWVGVLNPMTTVLREIWGTARENSDGRGGGNVATEVEKRGMWPQAKKCWQPPETERGKKQILPWASRRITALLTPSFHTSSSQNWERIHFCHFKPLSFWSFAMQPEKTNIPCFAIYKIGLIKVHPGLPLSHSAARIKYNDIRGNASKI